jgi:hypothetical protein
MAEELDRAVQEDLIIMARLVVPAAAEHKEMMKLDLAEGLPKLANHR